MFSTRDQLRALAGMPTTNDAKGRESLKEATKHAAVEKDGHFDFSVESEAAAGKIAVELAKESLPVDLTYAMDVFYFNFKSSKLLAQAEKLAAPFMKSVKEAIEDMDLNDDQRKGLEWAITDMLKAEGIEPTGLEVTHVQNESDAMKAFYVYEKDGKDVSDNVYFSAKFTDNGCTDFKEVKVK